MSKSRILFVDDETKILDGLRRMLRPYRQEWAMAFAESGPKALEILSQHKVDVIVSDIRMPGMSGSELLSIVKERYPRVVRIVLSGHSDLECIVKSVLPAHQYLSKPCKPEKLKAIIDQSIRITQYVKDENIKELITSLDSLPVLPQLYEDINVELCSDEPSLPLIAEIISQDVGMTAEILKLVNSSFFSIPRHISTVEQAVAMLGVNIIRSLVLTVHVFSVFDVQSTPLFSLHGLWEHCIRVSNLARRFCHENNCPRLTADNACIAGMLHDIGKLVLLSTRAAQYNEVLQKVHEENRRVWDIERELMGTTHAEVGAYLMGLWGMPDEVVEAIAFHHSPSSPLPDFRPLTAVYGANVLDHRHFIVNEHYSLPELDMDYLNSIGIADQIPNWERITQEYLEELDDGA